MTVTQQQAIQMLVELTESSRRQTAALEALIDAVPEGLTREELESVVRRFAALVESAGPRRGLCRFERPGVPA